MWSWQGPARRRWNSCALSRWTVFARPRHAWIVRPGHVQAHQTASRMARHPLIMLTARDDRDAMIEGINAGADDYIAKSADFDVLRPACALNSAANTSRMRTAVSREARSEGDRSHRAPAGGSGTEKARSAPARPAVLHTLSHRIQHRRADDDRSVWHYYRRHKQMEALTGCTRDELIGAPSKNYFTDPERAEAAIKLVLSEKKVTDYELTARAGRQKTECPTTPLPSTTGIGTLQGVLAVARDVTERKRNEQALQETNVELESAKSAAEKANLAKSEFLSSMSHELRSPLNAILGFAQLINSDFPPPTPSQTASIRSDSPAGWHLLKLINEILDLAVIESGKVSLSTDPCRWPSHVECQAMMEPQAQERASA